MKICRGWRLALNIPGKALLALVCAPGLALAAELGQPEPYDGDLGSLAAVNIRDAKLTRMVSGLKQPWAFEFLDTNTVIVTERMGRLLVIDLQDQGRKVISGVPSVANDKEQTGLLDVALHPRFSGNQRIYLSYVAADPELGQYFRTEVATGTLSGAQLVDVETVLIADPIGWSPSNFGGALAFDDEGYLFVSVGDRSDRDVAQRGDRLQGKILRLHDDGSTPGDNPFVDEPGVDDRIWALGVRNPQGLHFDPASGLLFEAEHGPMGGDEVNVVHAGRNYGWPQITYGRNYNTQAIGVGTHLAGLEQPLFYFLPSTAISPLTLYRGDMFPEWKGDLLVGALKGRHITRLDLDIMSERESVTSDKLLVRSATNLLDEINPRVRDIKVADDGSVYVLEQAGNLYRLWRESDGAQTARLDSGQGIPAATVYAAVCAGCHDSGAYEAPKIDDAEPWQVVRARKVTEVYDRVFDGVGNMPARGLCDFCSDQDLRAAIDWMLNNTAPQALE